MMKIRILKFLLTFVAIWLSVFPAMADTDVITNAYAMLNSDYINQINNREITIKGLQALSEADKMLRFSPGKSKLFVYYKRRMVRSFIYPNDKAGISEWADFSKKVISFAVKLSPKIEIIDFEMEDRFVQSVFKGLDGYSHYYGEFADSEIKTGLRRSFAARMLDDIIVIKIASFQKGIAEQVIQAVNQCANCKGAILDIRGNHGGLLDEALKVTDAFLDEGIITYTSGKENKVPQFYTAAVGDIFQNKPLAILVDGFTASAAEVLAAALSEQNRAVLIGTQTYGKGSIQNIVNLGNNRAMSLTTAHFFTPSGAEIDKAGLMPAVCTGGIHDVGEIHDAVCNRADHFLNDTDVDVAVKYLKNEL